MDDAPDRWVSPGVAIPVDVVHYADAADGMRDARALLVVATRPSQPTSAVYVAADLWTRARRHGVRRTVLGNMPGVWLIPFPGYSISPFYSLRFGSPPEPVTGALAVAALGGRVDVTEELLESLRNSWYDQDWTASRFAFELDRDGFAVAWLSPSTQFKKRVAVVGGHEWTQVLTEFERVQRVQFEREQLSLYRPWELPRG